MRGEAKGQEGAFILVWGGLNFSRSVKKFAPAPNFEVIRAMAVTCLGSTDAAGADQGLDACQGFGEVVGVPEPALEGVGL